MAIILITGTSTGIGFATAKILGRAGHKVYATMRSPARSHQLQDLANKEELPVTVLPLDVNNQESVNQAVEHILGKEKKIDVLVNNAGLAGGGAVEEVPFQEFEQVMETNFFGSLRCIHKVLPQMRERKSGCIINITSIAGRISFGGHSPYAASKFAIEAMSEALAAEVQPYNIKVAIVEPGVIETPIFSKGKPAPGTSHYIHRKRLVAMLMASLQKFHTSPDVVGEQIKEIIESDNIKLRYPVGPDAQLLIDWRNSFSDEEWIQMSNLDDKAWRERIKQDLSLDVDSLS